MFEIHIDDMCSDLDRSRIGGGAFIKGIYEWPVNKEGEPLVLVASLSRSFLEEVGYSFGYEFEYISVFSMYLKDDYFLDRITYHGDPLELEEILSGSTVVLFHKKGGVIQGDLEIPPREIKLGNLTPSIWHGSGVAGDVCFLQKESMPFVNDMKFGLQLYSGDFPEPFSDVFGLSDAIGYLFFSLLEKKGIFFVQTS